MNLIKLFVAITLFYQPLSVAQDAFRGFTSEQSTISSALIRSEDGIEPISLKVSGRDSEQELSFYVGDSQKNKLVLVMAGLGGDGKGGLSNFLAIEAAKRGYTSLVLPSVFSEVFASNFSSTGYVGYVHPDIVDCIRLIRESVRLLENKLGFKFIDKKILGYSLGALTAAHLSERISKSDNISNVVLINTPVDLGYGLRVIDQFRAQKEFLSTSTIKLKLKWFLRLRKYLKRSLDIFNFTKFAEGLPSDLADKQYIIGSILSGSLRSVVLSSQERLDLGVLPQKNRKKAAKKVMFEGYFKQFLVPYYRQVEKFDYVDFNFINTESSLPAVESHLRANNNIYLFHNSDDFLLRGQEDADYLKEVFGKRLKLYNSGGHLGNVWYPEILNSVFKALSL